MVPFGAGRHSMVDRGGSRGCRRVFSGAQSRGLPQELVVPPLGDDILNVCVRLPYYGVTNTRVSATIPQ